MEYIRSSQIYKGTSMSMVGGRSERRKYAPIPMTVPYSLLLSASCAETGHRQMNARNVRRIRESEEAMRRDFARHGRRYGLVIAVDDVEEREVMVMCMEKPVLILPAEATYRKCLDTSTLSSCISTIT